MCTHVLPRRARFLRQLHRVGADAEAKIVDAMRGYPAPPLGSTSSNSNSNTVICLVRARSDVHHQQALCGRVILVTAFNLSDIGSFNAPSHALLMRAVTLSEFELEHLLPSCDF